MDCRIGYVIVGVTNLDRAIAFTATRSASNSSTPRPSSTSPNSRSVTCASRSRAAMGADGNHKVGGNTGIGFAVDDLDEAHADLAANGVTFTMEPEQQPWGATWQCSPIRTATCSIWIRCGSMRSHRPQRLLEVGDQVVGILDPDRDAHQVVGDPSCALRAAGTERWVMPAGWLASVSVPPRLTASLAILSASRNANASRLAALQDRARRCSRRRCSGGGRCPCWRGVVDVAEIAEAFDLGMVLAGRRRPSPRSPPARVMRSSSVSRLRSSIHAVLGSQIVADRVAHHADRVDPLLRARRRRPRPGPNGRRRIWSANRRRCRRRA